MSRGQDRAVDPPLTARPTSSTTEWFEKVFEHAPTGIAITDWAGHVQQCNPAYRRLVGYAEEELRSVDFAELVHPEDRAENVAALSRLQAGEIPFIEIENRYLRPDGSSVWVHKYVSVLADGPNGGRDHLLALVTDVTERRHLDELRHERDEQFAAMFEYAPVGVAHVDLEGRFVRVNPAFASITGRRVEELEGVAFKDITHPDDVAIDLEHGWRLFNGEIPRFSYRKRYLRTDGSPVWVSLTGSMVRDEAGEALYGVAVIEDISADLEREMTERRARELAELTADIVSCLEGADDEQEQARAVTELLVPGFADFATVEAPHAGDPMLAATHRDPELLSALVELRSRYRLDSTDPSSVARAVDGQHQVGSTPKPVRDRFPLEDEARRLLDRLDPHSYLTVGLDLGKDRRGVVLAGRSDPEHEPFDEQDLEFLERLAERAGVLMAGARIRVAEHDIAARLQHALLPDHLASADGIEVAGRYYAIGEALDVGGDWYDSIALADGRVLLVVGDVVGHGLGAAAIMGRLRAGLAALAARTSSPGQLLDELDRFARSPQGGDFATVVAAALDPTTGSVTYASAGHPPMLVIGPWGDTEWLEEAGSVPLCSFAVEGRPEASATLPPGSWLVAFSDGLLERRGEPIDVGLRRVAEVAPGFRHGTAQDLCDGLIAALTADSVPEDDVVVLAVRFRPLVKGGFRRRLAPEPSQLAPLRVDLRRWVEAQHLPPSVEGDLQLVVGEACANAVEHAYHGQPGGTIEVTVHLTGHHLEVVVRDHGRWRNPGHTEGRGRGTGIMQSLTTSFDRTTDEDGTIVSAVVPVAPEEAP